MLRRATVQLAVIWVLVSTLGAASEARPSSQSEVRKGLERGAALRKQTQLVPGVVQRYALLMKAGGVRCGHAMVTIEAAKGDAGAGAVYKLSEQLKAAMAGEGESAVIDYDAAFLLGADLGLLSGQMRTHSKLSKPAGTDSQFPNNRKLFPVSVPVQQELVSQASVAVRDDALIWELTQSKEDGKDAAPKVAKKFPMHGVRPIPKNALFGVAAFASAAAKDGWQLDGKESYCVPTLDLGWEMDNFAIGPAWITFTPPAPADPKGSAARMNVRWLVGEIEEKGLQVEPPEPAVWLARQTWPLDAHCCPLAHPKPDDPRITAESADPATLDLNTPLDLEKIAAAMKPGTADERR